jgi:diguanylate cyclase (GGDEF)-like protein/PAS domain S-box-containing protein
MNSDDKHECVLLIENNPADAIAIREILATSPVDVEWVQKLSDGLERLGRAGIGAVMLNLSLPDSQGIATFDKLSAAVPHIPILILSDSECEDLATLSIQRGAQDYVLKRHLDRYWLPRALRNIIERKILTEALFLEKERAQVMLNSIGDAVLSTDVSGNVTYLNLVAEAMTGWPWREASGRPVAEVFKIIDGSTREPARSPLELAIQENRIVGLATNSILIRRDGYESGIEDSSAPIHDREGHVTGGVIVFHDVSVARAMALQMSHLAQHDCLTDLPNRILLKVLLTHAIALARRHDYRLAVLFLDLDRFKNINDAMGHVMGDELLKLVAKRLVACLRGSDRVSREGADEFVVMLSDIKSVDHAAEVARKILSELMVPYSIDHHELDVTTSIGISIYPDDFEDAEALLRAADTAMSDAKKKGRNNYQFFRNDMNIRARERQSLEGSLRHALERKEFVLHYQPKINLATGAITGAEALIRWLHPDRGLVSPGQFLPIAEDCGLMVPIGQWVTREACTQVRAWMDAGLPATPVSVNISATEFRNDGYIADLRSILTDVRLEPRYLEIELTETVLIQHSEATASMLQALKAMGIRLALDDFGTGYSSLSYLRRFPIDALKIDRSFVQEIADGLTDAPIIKAVIGMGKSIRLHVIAEGVETREQFAFLQDQHCDEGQGYYFSPPVVAEQFAELLKASMGRNGRPLALVPSS